MMEKETLLYQDVRNVLLMEELVDDLFVSSGTLLGVVRDGGTIKDDDDFDSAYVSRHRDSDAVSKELVKIAMTLNAYGFDAHVSVPMRTHLHVHRSNDYDTRIDVFMWYITDEDHLRIPSGVATDAGEVSWSGSTDEKYKLNSVPVSTPLNAEEVLAFYYGEDWTTPKTGFDWHWGLEVQRIWKTTRLSYDQVKIVSRTRPVPVTPRPPCEK